MKTATEEQKDYSAEIYTAIFAVFLIVGMGFLALETRTEPRPATDFVAHVETMG